MGNLLCFVAMLLGALSRGTVQSALLGLALASSMRLPRTVNYTVRQFTALESDMTSVERLLHISDLSKEPSHLQTPAPVDWKPNDGSICFTAVSMRYRPGLPLVLNDISFSLPHANKLGVCGRTGSGKSSLIQALFRLTTLEAGSVVIGGIDISTVAVRELRGALSICPQDPVIFSGTIATNLDPFEEFEPATLSRACKQVGLDHLTCDELVQEGGSNFSAGTRQMLVLARALLQSSKVLVLDEATSSISPEIDARIQKVLAAQFANVTRVVIAHRLQTIMDADMILVISDGRVAEVGPPNELLQNPSGALTKLIE